MAKKFGKLVLLSALAGAAAAGTYYCLQKKQDDPLKDIDAADDFDDFDDDFDDEEDAPTEAHSNKNRSYVSLDLDNAKEIIGEKVIETIDKTKEKIENFNVSEKLDKAKEIIEEMTQPAAEPESSKEEPAPEKNEEEKNADNSSSISIAYADDDDEASSEEFFDDEDEECEDKPEA